MNRITHLTSQRAGHIQNHYEERLTEAFGRSWWLVFPGLDNIKPEFIGGDDKLPSYARKQLAQLRADPEVGARRRARHIDVSMAFFPGEDCDGIPHDQNVCWLKQYKRPSATGRYSTEKGYLVVCDPHNNESYPVQIWESRPTKSCPRYDLLESFFTLVWKRPPEED